MAHSWKQIEYLLNWKENIANNKADLMSRRHSNKDGWQEHKDKTVCCGDRTTQFLFERKKLWKSCIFTS